MTTVPAIQLDRLSDKLEAMRATLEAIEDKLQPDDYQDYDSPISDTQEIHIALFGKRRLFVLAMATLTIIVQGYSTPIQLTTASGVWLNITFPEGTVIKTTGQASAVFVHFRATNKSQP